MEVMVLDGTQSTRSIINTVVILAFATKNSSMENVVLTIIQSQRYTTFVGPTDKMQRLIQPPIFLPLTGARRFDCSSLWVQSRNGTARTGGQRQVADR